MPTSWESRKRNEKLRAAVEGAKVPVHVPGTKAEVIDFYRDKYKGTSKKWTVEAAKEIAGTADKKSTAYKSAIRQFQGDRLRSEPKTAADKAKWADIGKRIEPISYKLRNNSITVVVQGQQDRDGHKAGKRNRAVRVTFTGADAYAFVSNPTYEAIWEEYDYNFDEDEDGEYSLSVTGVSAS